MAGFRIPKQGTAQTIDLSEFGGEGQLRVNPIRLIDSIALVDYITSLARAEGILVKSDADIQKLISERYGLKSTMFYIKLLVEAIEDDKPRKLTDEELADIPPELFAEILDIINKGADFPLAQKGGKARK